MKDYLGLPSPLETAQRLANKGLTLEITSNGSLLRLALKGELQSKSIPWFKEVFASLASRNGHSSIEVNLAGLRKIDGLGWAALAWGKETMRHGSTYPHFQKPGPPFWPLLAEGKFNHILNFPEEEKTPIQLEGRGNHRRPFSPQVPFLWRWCQRLMALIGLILTSPLMLLIALLVKAESKGPAIYRQWRVGQRRVRGTPEAQKGLFQLHKFRTMRDGAEGEVKGLLRHNEYG